MQGKVQVGVATVTGYSVSTVAFVGAVLAYLGGDHSDQTVAIIGCGLVGALAFAITNIGRYWQAKVAIQNPPAAAPGATPMPVYGSVGASTASASAGYVSSSVDTDAGVYDPLPHELAGSEVSQPALPDVGDGEQVKGDE